MIRRKLIQFIRYITRLNLGWFLFNWMTNRKYERIEFASIEEISHKYPDRVENIIENNNTVSYAPPAFELKVHPDNILQHIEGYKNKMVIIKDVVVVGGSNLIMTDHSTGIYDLKFNDRNNNISFSDQLFGYYTSNYAIIDNEDEIGLVHKGIMLAGNYSFNYYHWMMEFIVKIKIIDESTIAPEIPIILDRVCVDVPQYKELIDLLNIFNRQYIILDKFKRYRVDELYYVSPVNLIPPSFRNIKTIKPDDFLFHLETIDYLRKSLLLKQSNIETPELVYVSREKASSRRVFNENKVFDELSKLNFVKVCPEDMTLTDQIRLFNHARFIIGGSGAAFTNLIFCSKGCNIIILTNYKFPISIFSTISYYLHLNLVYLTDETLDLRMMKSLHDRFNINTDHLTRLILQMMKNSL